MQNESGRSVTSGNIKVEIAPGPLPLATITRVSDGRVLLAETEIAMTPGPSARARVDAAAGATRSPPAPPCTDNCTTVENTDFNGHDLPNGHNKTTNSAAECCSLCQADPACNFWTYVTVPAAHGCWKKAVVKTVLTNQAGHTSGVKGCGPLPPAPPPPAPSPPPAPPPPPPAIATYTASVAFGGLGPDEGVYGLGEHRGSPRCDNQCVNTTLYVCTRNLADCHASPAYLADCKHPSRLQHTIVCVPLSPCRVMRTLANSNHTEYRLYIDTDPQRWELLELIFRFVDSKADQVVGLGNSTFARCALPAEQVSP